MKVALCVPSCRPDSLRDFLAAWGTPEHRFWTRLYILDGSDGQAIEADGAEVIRFADIDATLGEDSWIISKRDSARRCFGLWKAWRDGADTIVTLDDDTRPIAGRDFLAGHVANLHATPRWASPVPDFEPRGLPYRDRGTLADVAISVGLWCGVPDQDAAHQLVSPLTDWTPPEGSRVLPAGQFQPICGMNLAAVRRAAPLLYFGLQGPPWEYARFDDIWMGVVARKVCDHLGWSIVAGRPWVRHERASDPIRNLVKEAPGIAMNERLWRAVDRIGLTASAPAACMAEVGRGLGSPSEGYLSRLGEALQIWAGLFDG